MIRLLSQFLILFLIMPALCCAGELNVDQSGLALKGYDAVAYINDGKAVLGTEKYSLKWDNAVWYFSSSLYRDVFAKYPPKYMPQYGGYCAFSMAQGKKIDVDPKAFAVVDGKLYLIFSTAFLKVWQQNYKMFIPQSDAAWTKLKFK